MESVIKLLHLFTHLLEHLDDLILTEVVREVGHVKLRVLDVLRGRSGHADLDDKTTKRAVKGTSVGSENRTRTQKKFSVRGILVEVYHNITGAAPRSMHTRTLCGEVEWVARSRKALSSVRFMQLPQMGPREEDQHKNACKPQTLTTATFKKPEPRYYTSKTKKSWQTTNTREKEPSGQSTLDSFIPLLIFTPSVFHHVIKQNRIGCCKRWGFPSLLGYKPTASP